MSQGDGSDAILLAMRMMIILLTSVRTNIYEPRRSSISTIGAFQLPTNNNKNQPLEKKNSIGQRGDVAERGAGGRRGIRNTEVETNGIL